MFEHVHMKFLLLLFIYNFIYRIHLISKKKHQENYRLQLICFYEVKIALLYISVPSIDP